MKKFLVKINAYQYHAKFEVMAEDNVESIEKLRPSAKQQLEPVAYHSWFQNPFSEGDWAIWGPGQIRKFAKNVSTPHGQIHFCGEHTAVANRGMEGAMESGERAALEVLGLL